MTRLEAPQSFKRLSKAFIIVILCLETALIVMTIRVSSFFNSLPPDLRLTWTMIIWTLLLVLPTVFNLLGSYLFYVSAHTVMEFDQTSITLQRPFREWSGPWTSIKKAYIHGNGLNLQTTESFWRTWTLRLNPKFLPLLEEIRGRLRSGVWINERQARWYVFRHVAPVIIMTAAFGLIAGWIMDQKVFPDLNKQTKDYLKSHPREREDR